MEDALLQLARLPLASSLQRQTASTSWTALQVTLQTLLYTQDQQELGATQQLLCTFCSANQPGCSQLLGTVQMAATRPGPGGSAARTFGSMLLAALLASGGHSLQVCRKFCCCAYHACES